MNVVKRTIKSLINNEGLEYSEYVISDRALPSLIDGLKPSQRYFLYSAIKNASTKFKKVAAISGVVSEYGYNHAETSILDTGASMANTWANNYPIIKGQGNFGSRTNRDAAAARYIFAKIDDNFENMFKDNDLLLPSSKHGSDLPEFYLPIIPFVLLNGVSGIAVGYATDIPPHCPESVAKECIKYIGTNDCGNPTIKFPEFNGTVDQSNRTVSGLVKFKTKNIVRIEELPPSYDRAKYVTKLDKLVSENKILSYADLCGTTCDFEFEINLKRDHGHTEQSLYKLFDLTESFKYNINVINQDNKRVNYEHTSQLVKDFVDYRIAFYPIRIKRRVDELTSSLGIVREKIRFIDEFSTGLDVKLKSVSRKKCIELLNEMNYNHSELLIGMPIHQLTVDEIQKLNETHDKLEKELSYWTNTTDKIEFVKDIERFLSYYKKQQGK